jgi:hypothetical protein
MDESALRMALASLDDCSSSLHWLLGFWTFLVVGGVALELVFVIWEYLDDSHDFRRGFVHPPHKPSVPLFVLGFFGAGLVAVGVSGELYAESRIGTVETCIRKGNDSLFLLLSKEAGGAATSAKTAHDEVDVVKKETDELTRRLGRAATQLDVIEDDVRAQGPRWRLLEAGKTILIGALKPFAGQTFTVVRCGEVSPPEAMKLERDLYNFLGIGNDSAGWVLGRPGVTSWSECINGASSVGGNLVTFSSNARERTKDAAKALSDVLNKLEIGTINIPSLPSQLNPLSLQFHGPGSAWELAAKDPTQVFILIGPNPMFDLAGWKKQQKSRHK